MVIYRILRLIVNVFCIFITFTLFTIIFFLFSNPGFLLEAFLMAGIVLYGWFSNLFYVMIIRSQKTMTKRQKDLLQVNAIVALVFAVLGVSNSVLVYLNPHILDEAMSQMPIKNINMEQMMKTNAGLLFAFCLIMATHVVWTYLLVRKHKESFV